MNQSANMWDDRYAGDDYAYGTEPNDVLREQADRLPTGAILCIGEGEGRNGVFLARRGCRVTAVDGSAVGLAKVEQLARDQGVEIETVHADLARFEITPECWDSVVSIFCRR